MLARIVTIFVLLLIPVGILLGFFGPQIIHGLSLMFIAGSAFFVVLAGLIILIGAAMLAGRGPGPAIAITLAVILGCGGIINAIGFSYNTDKIYTADVNVVKTPAPDFSDRAPYDVAVATSKRNLGDTTGTAVGVKSLLDEADHGIWSTLVIRRGVLVGYEAVRTYDVPLYGTTTAKMTKSCEFNLNAAGHRAGGFLPQNSLDYKILAAVPLNTTFDAADLYSYCDGKTPMVVAPLKSLSGFWLSSWTASGVALYNGTTGELTIEKDTSKIPGPTYPLSLAAKQRSSMNATGGFSDYFFGRSGFETTDGDEGDPNAGNTTEMGLRFLGKKDGAYVTPLTPRGDSSSVIALATIDSTTATAGKRNPITIHRYTDARQANTSIVQSMKSTYSWMPDWSTGLKVFEIVPAADGSWIASIGQAQSVVYRAVVSADGNAILYDETGAEVTRTGTAKDDASTPSTAPAANSDLAALTPDQLRSLANAILDEMANRAAK